MCLGRLQAQRRCGLPQAAAGAARNLTAAAAETRRPLLTIRKRALSSAPFSGRAKHHQATEAENCVPVAATDTFHRASQSDHDRCASRAAASPRRSSLTKRPRARISAPRSLAVRPATWVGSFEHTATATGSSRCANPERKRASGRSWRLSRTVSVYHWKSSHSKSGRYVH